MEKRDDHDSIREGFFLSLTHTHAHTPSNTNKNVSVCMCFALLLIWFFFYRRKKSKHDNNTRKKTLSCFMAKKTTTTTYNLALWTIITNYNFHHCRKKMCVHVIFHLCIIASIWKSTVDGLRVREKAWMRSRKRYTKKITTKKGIGKILLYTPTHVVIQVKINSMSGFVLVSGGFLGFFFSCCGEKWSIQMPFH